MGEFDQARERGPAGEESADERVRAEERARAGAQGGAETQGGAGEQSRAEERARAEELGSVSTEFAVALPGVVLILGLLLSLGMHGAAQVALEEGARAAARELARGEDPAAAEQTASRVAGDGVSATISRDGAYSQVELTRPVRLLGMVELDLDQSAVASARTEHVPTSEDSP